MGLRRMIRPNLEGLESRITPAVSVRLNSAGLFIQSDNLANKLTIAETATPGKFQLTNNGKAVGQFSFSNLFVKMGNGNDTVDLQVKTAITGNVNVSLGNGADTFTTVNSTPGSRIGGSALVSTGRGIPLGVDAGVNGKYDDYVQVFNLNVGGNLTVLGVAGSAASLLNMETSKIGGSLAAVNISAIGLGSFTNPAGAVTVGGNLSVNNALKNTDGRVGIGSGPGNAITLNAGAVVNGNLSYVGGSGIDRLNLPAVDVTTPVLIGGSLNVNAGDGTNTLQLGNFAFGAQIGGNATYSGGAGVDRIFFDSGASVAGNFFLNVGEGDNLIFGGPSLGATVGGSLTVLAGNGDNTFGEYTDGTLSVGGGLSIRVGNGTNSNSFFNTKVSVGGVATFQAGTGTNDLTITNETIADLRLIFSGGPTTLMFTQASGSFNGNLFIDFGTGFGPKSFAGSTAAFDGAMVTILNF